MKLKNILHATDFSACAKGAASIAVALARDYGAKLWMLHVRPAPLPVVGEFGALPPPERESEASLQSSMRRLLPADCASDVEYLVRDGDAEREIVEAAEQNQCDLIVLGTHGRSGIGRLILGSVAEAVMRTALCPVLTIKPTPVSTPTPTDAEVELRDDELVTVSSVATPAEAEVIRDALKREGIRCFLESAQQGGFVGTLGIPVKVQVPMRDRDRASKFLRRCEKQRQRA